MDGHLIVACAHSASILGINNNVVRRLLGFFGYFNDAELPGLLYTKRVGNIFLEDEEDHVGPFDIIPLEAEVQQFLVPGLGYIDSIPRKLSTAELNQMVLHLGAINCQFFARGKKRSMLYSTDGDVAPGLLPEFGVTVSQVTTFQAGVLLRTDHTQCKGFVPYTSYLADGRVTQFLQAFQFGTVQLVNLPPHLFRVKHEVGRTIQVSGVSYKAKEKDIRDFFSFSFGSTVSMFVGVRNKGSRLVFIKFKEMGVAEKAIEQSQGKHGIRFRGVRLDIHPAFRTEVRSTVTGSVKRKKKFGPK